MDENYIYTIKDMKNAILEACNTYPNYNALSLLKDDDSIYKLTYSELLKELKKIEDLYINIQFKDHDRVAVIIPHQLYAVISVLGLIYAGAIVVPIDASLPISEIEQLLLYADVAGVFVSDHILEKISDTTKAKYPFVVLTNDYNFVLDPSQRTIARECDIYDNDPEVMAILFSSGTTSKMKGICVSYRSILEAIPTIRDLMNIVPGKDTELLYVFPINHIAGLVLFLHCFLPGGNACMIETLNATQLMKAMQIFQPYYFFCIPKVFEIIQMKIDETLATYGKIAVYGVHFMMNVAGYLRKYFRINIGKFIFKKINHQVFGPHMWEIGGGGTQCKPETSAFFWKLGYTWFEFYAATETSLPAIATSAKDRSPVGINGKVDRYKEIEIKVVSKDIDGIGEICIKSPYMMTGYFRDPELTKNAFDEQGFFLTGDLGFIDKKNNLHVVGRKKEVIIMHNGKKASPDDLERIYGEKLNNISFAVCGIPTRNGFDEIHLFAELPNGKTKEQLKLSIMDALSDINGIYKVSKIHTVSKLPLARTGKVQRSLLAQQTLTSIDNETRELYHSNTADRLSIDNIISSICGVHVNDLDDSQWLVDVGIDSLSMVELETKIEQKYNINISNQLVKIQTIGDLKRTVEMGNTDISSFKVSNDEPRDHFPKPRTTQQIRKLNYIVNKLPKFYDVAVFNENRIDPNKPCIICVNHQSYFDALPVIYLLSRQNIDVSKVAYLVAHHLYRTTFQRHVCTLLGGIPIDRFINSMPAYQDMTTWIQNGGSVIIHPEGCISTNGSILPFKNGAAKLAIEQEIPILPIRIDGTNVILPKGASTPKFRINGKKCKINIFVGNYIYPTDTNVSALTDKLRSQVLGLTFS